MADDEKVIPWVLEVRVPDLATLNLRLKTLENKVSDLTAAVTRLTTSLQPAIGRINEDVGNLQTIITNQTSIIAGLRGLVDQAAATDINQAAQLAEVTTRANALQTAADGQAAAAQASVDAINQVATALEGIDPDATNPGVVIPDLPPVVTVPPVDIPAPDATATPGTPATTIPGDTAGTPTMTPGTPDDGAVGPAVDSGNPRP